MNGEDKTIREKIGSRLKELRHAAGQTQEELAERADVHVTHVAKIEAGERSPSVEVLVRLAAGLGVPMARIVEGVDHTPAAPDPHLVGDVVKLLKKMSAEQLQYTKRFIQFVILNDEFN